MTSQADIRRRVRVWQITHDIGRAMSTGDVDLGDGNSERLKRFWTQDPRGLARWATRPSGRYRALVRQLAKHMPVEKAKRVAADWFHEVIGYAPGSDLNRVHAGKPPRGKRVGPG